MSINNPNLNYWVIIVCAIVAILYLANIAIGSSTSDKRKSDVRYDNAGQK